MKNHLHKDSTVAVVDPLLWLLSFRKCSPEGRWRASHNKHSEPSPHLVLSYLSSWCRLLGRYRRRVAPKEKIWKDIRHQVKVCAGAPHMPMNDMYCENGGLKLAVWNFSREEAKYFVARLAMSPAKLDRAKSAQKSSDSDGVVSLITVILRTN